VAGHHHRRRRHVRQANRTLRALPGRPNGLSSPAISSLASDANGIWVGTAAGLDYIDLAHGGLIRHYPRAATAARAPTRSARWPSTHRRLWIGSNAGLARRDAASGAIADLPFANGAADAVLSLASSRAGEVVFGTLKSGIGVASAGDGAAPAGHRSGPGRQQRDGAVAGRNPARHLVGRHLRRRRDRVRHQRPRPPHRAPPGHADQPGPRPRGRHLARPSGLVWVANERGVDIHNPANHSVDTILDGVGLPEISAFAFMSDSAGRLWVALGDQGIDLIAPDGSRRAGLRPDPPGPTAPCPTA
jgi:ligand-binding sensor domain-containing protein